MMCCYSNKTVAFLMLFIILTFFVGCYKIYEHHMPTAVDMSFQQRQKIPLRAGLYMSEDFLHYSYEWEVEFGKHVFPIGAILQNGSKDMIKAAFQDMIIVLSPEEANTKRVDVVISPSVETVILPYELKMRAYQDAGIFIKWMISDIEGNPIWVETIEGNSHLEKERLYQTREELMDKSLQLAIENQFQKSFQKIVSSNWWASIKE